MAAGVKDTLAPSSISGSGVYGLNTAWVEGNKASKSPVHDTKEEILRLRVKGSNLRRGKNTGWENIVILRARHRKVAIHLLSNQRSQLGRKKQHWYVVRSASHAISTDHIGF